MTVPYTFATATTSLPLNQLDSNFNTPITLGNTAIYLGNTTTFIGNLNLGNVIISSGNVIVTSVTTTNFSASNVSITGGTINNVSLANITGTSVNISTLTVTTITSPAATNLTLQTANVTAITIDAAQNVGIGTSSPLGRLALGSLVSNQVLSMYDDATNWYGFGISSNNFQMSAATGAAITFNNITRSGGGSLTERMRIDSGGNLLVGQTSSTPANDASAGFCAGSGSAGGYGSSYVKIPNTAASGYSAFSIFRGSSAIGTISYNGVGVNYNVTSDQRLKEDEGIYTDTSIIDNTVIHNFKWLSNGLSDCGVFAQEAKLIKPLAVTEGTDELGENGLLVKPWGVDYSKYVPDLIVYCQQLKARVEALEAQLVNQ
jgi:hypothetical protein